jgi:hypothetical protein
MRGIVGEERRGKETDGCLLTSNQDYRPVIFTPLFMK